MDPLLLPRDRHPRDRRVQPHVDAVPLERLLDDGGGIRVLFHEELSGPLDDGRLRPAPAEDLGQFAPDRTGAEHQDPPRQLGEGENGLVRQKPRLDQPFPPRMAGPPPAGPHRLAEPQGLSPPLPPLPPPPPPPS